MADDKQDRPAKTTGRTTSVRGVLVGDFLNVTWRMAVPTVLGVAAGYWLDEQFHTSPALFLLGALVGFAGGVLLAIRVINRVKGGDS